MSVRTDKIRLRPAGTSAYTGIPLFDTLALKSDYVEKQVFLVNRLEYVYDNTIVKTLNIMNGLRYKFYIDLNYQIKQPTTAEGRKMFNFRFDARNYYPIFRNFIWAVRAAGDFSWGNQKIIYYLGGQDGSMFQKQTSFLFPIIPKIILTSLSLSTSEDIIKM